MTIPPRSTVPVTTLVGLSLLAGAALLLEIALTRLLSVTLWYHFAFFIVSSALLGLSAAGVALGVRRSASEVSDAALVRAALSVPVSIAVGLSLFNVVPFEPLELGSDPWQWLWLLVCVLLAAAPFFSVGLTIAAILTKYAASVHRLYLYDLVGAGLGSFAVAWALPLLGGVGTVLLSAIVAAAGAALVAHASSRRGFLVACALTFALCAVLPLGESLPTLRISRSKTIGAGAGVRTAAQVLADRSITKLTLWNTLSRLDVLEHPDPRRHRGKARTIAIDGGTAFTRLAHPEGPLSTLGPTADEQSFFYKRHRDPSVLVVGSGGGYEVLLALRNGVSQVWAVEINPGINRIVTKDMAWFTGHLYDDPRVHWRTDEARSFLRRSAQKHHVIHCPHTISNAALSTGSLGLSENYLLTKEAFADFFAHLLPSGVLLITRPEAHLPRLVSTARRALLETRGAQADTRRAALVWKLEGQGQSFFAGAAFSKDGFDQETVAAFTTLARTLGLRLLYSPDQGGEAPYAQILSGELDEVSFIEKPFPAILAPATDDKPFFNQRMPLSRLRLKDLTEVFSGRSRARESLEDRPLAEAALLALLLEVSLAGVLVIIVPLALSRRRALRGRGVGLSLAAFFALGLGFIVVEMGLVQRFALYLGKPVVLLSTVFGGLLLASGLGAGLSRRLSGRRVEVVAPLAAAALAMLLGALAPLFTGATLAWPEPARVAVTLALIAPLGLVMGTPFPLLLSRLERGPRDRIPWAYGVNGLASVVGTIAAVVLGMAAGYSSVTWLGAVCYLAAASCAAADWE